MPPGPLIKMSLYLGPIDYYIQCVGVKDTGTIWKGEWHHAALNGEQDL